METVSHLSDDQLREMGLRYGDVIALRIFVRTRQLHGESAASEPSASSSSEQRRSSLLRRLQDRLGEQRSKRSKMVQNKNAKRSQRRVELGWLHYDQNSHRYVQVRPCKGGGIRHISVATSTTPAEILRIGQRLYFPDGVSSKGPIDTFQTKLVDVQHRSVDDGHSVGELYAQTCVPLLRLYLATQQLTVSSYTLCCTSLAVYVSHARKRQNI